MERVNFLVIDYNEVVVADWSGRFRITSLSSTAEGFEQLVAEVDVPMHEAMMAHEQFRMCRALVGSAAKTGFEGRLVSIMPTETGLSVTAAGHIGGLNDVLYTAAWENSRCVEALEEQSETVALGVSMANNLWQLNRGTIAAVNGTTYSSARNAAVRYLLPMADSRKYIGWFSIDFHGEASLTYSFDFEVWAITESGGAFSYTQEYTITRSSSLTTTRNQAVSTANCIGLAIVVRPSFTTFSGDTGTIYATVNSLLVKTNSSSTFHSLDNIAADVVAAVSDVNPHVISDDDSQIGNHDGEMGDFAVMDKGGLDVLRQIAARPDSDGNVRQLSVWEDGKVRLQVAGKWVHKYFVWLEVPNIEGTVMGSVNDGYGRYDDDGYGRSLATGRVRHKPSILVGNNTTIQSHISTGGTVEDDAEDARDVLVGQGAIARPRAGLRVNRVYDSSGARVPLWYVRGGDTVVVQNLVLFGGNRVQEFTVFRASFDGRLLTIEPERGANDFKNALNPGEAAVSPTVAKVSDV